MCADMRENIMAWLKIVLLLLDEAIVVGLLFLILWKLDVPLHIGGVIAIACVVAVIVFFLHKALLPVLQDRPKPNSSNMIGLEGKVVTMLSPKGIVKIRGELWKAAALEATVEVGDSIVVVGIEGLKLLVKPQHPNMESEASF